MVVQQREKGLKIHLGGHHSAQPQGHVSEDPDTRPPTQKVAVPFKANKAFANRSMYSAQLLTKGPSQCLSFPLWQLSLRTEEGRKASVLGMN